MGSQRVRHEQLNWKHRRNIMDKQVTNKQSFPLKWKWKFLSCVRLFGTSWTLQSMEFSRPEYWSGQPFPSPADLPNPGIKPRSPIFQADSLPAKPQGKPRNTGLGSLMRALMPWNYSLNSHQFGVQHIFLKNQYTLTIEIHSWGCEMQSVANIYKHGPLQANHCQKCIKMLRFCAFSSS